MDQMVEEFRSLISGQENLDEGIIDFFKGSIEKISTIARGLKDVASKMNQKSLDNLIIALEKASGGNWSNMSLETKIKNIKDKKFLNIVIKTYTALKGSTVFANLPAAIFFILFLFTPGYGIKEAIKIYLKNWVFFTTIFTGYSLLDQESEKASDDQVKTYIKDIEFAISKLKKLKAKKTSEEIEKMMQGAKV
jgi:hypothetical protein